LKIFFSIAAENSMSEEKIIVFIRRNFQVKVPVPQERFSKAVSRRRSGARGNPNLFNFVRQALF
jgi:hypothetical protein